MRNGHVLIALALVATVGVAAGAYLLGRTNAPSTADADATKEGAYEEAYDLAFAESSENSSEEGEAKGVDAGREAGIEGGEADGSSKGSAEAEAELAAQEAAEAAALSPTPAPAADPSAQVCDGPGRELSRQLQLWAAAALSAGPGPRFLHLGAEYRQRPIGLPNGLGRPPIRWRRRAPRAGRTASSSLQRWT